MKRIAIVRSIGFLALLLTSRLIHAQNTGDPDRPYKNQQPHGKWTIWSDSLKTKIESTGKYRNGKERGTWRYFSPTGQLLKKEHYRAKFIQTRYYHENGKRKSSGKARLTMEEEYIHYFVDGKWKEFDSRGKRLATVWYNKGEEIRREDR